MKKLLLFTLLLPMLATAQIVKPPKVTGGGTGTAVDVVNNLNQTTTGKALDATQGVTLKNLIAAKLSIADTNTFLRKITGWRLISPAEISKLNNLAGTNTGDQSLSLNGTQLSLSNGGGTVTLPSGGSSTPLTNNLTTTTTGTALDAAQGKALKDQVDAAQTTANNAQTAAGTAQTTANGKQATLVSGTSIKTVGGQSLLGSGDIPLPSGGSATPLANNLTTTSTGSALDALQGKRLGDSLTVHRTDINTNKTAAATAQSAANAAQSTANAKQNTITTSTNLAAASVTVNTLTDSDSTGRVANTDWVRRYVLRTMPRSFAYDPTQFDTTKSSLTILPSYIRGLFSGTGYNAATGVISGGGTSGPFSLSGTVGYYNGGSVGIGTNIPYSLFTVNGNAQAAEFHVTGANNAQTDSYRIGKLADFGVQIGGSWAFNSGGTMYNQGNAEVKADGTLSLKGSQVTVNDRPLTFRPNSVASIVTAWNAATSNTTVHIQPGSYDFTGVTLLISGKNNVTLKADKDVTLFNTNGGTIILSNGNNTNVTIDGLTLTTSFVQTSGTPDLNTSLLYTNEQGTNTGVEVKNCKFSAPTCRMNLVTTSAYSSRKSGGNGQGKLQTNLSYHDNEFGPGGRMGIELTSHTNEDSLYTTIFMRNVSIKNNYFHDLGLLARPDNVKNGMGPSVSGPIEMVEIANNHLIDCNLLGIETAGAKRVNITDNVIDYVNQAFTGISVSDNTTRFDARDINIVGNHIRSKIKGINMYRVAETNAANNQVKVDQDTGDGGTVYIQECLGVTLTGGSVQGRANNTIRVDNSNQVQIGGGIRLKNDRVNFSLVSIFGSSAAPSTWVAVDADCMFIKANGPSTSGVVEIIGTTSNITGNR